MMNRLIGPLGLGDELFWEPARVVPPDPWAGHLPFAFWLAKTVRPAAFVELQQRFAREYLDALLEGGATLVRAARRTADETLLPLEQQIEQRRQGRQPAQGYQRAAAE